MKVTTPKIHSADLYQLFSYLNNARQGLSDGVMVEGMLLYPTITKDVELSYTLGQYRVRVATVDLSRDWRAIHDRLLYLISDQTDTNAQKARTGSG